MLDIPRGQYHVSLDDAQAQCHGLRRHQETGSNVDRRRSGRPRASSARDDAYLQFIARRRRQITAGHRQIAWQPVLSQRVSIQTVRNRSISMASSSYSCVLSYKIAITIFHNIQQCDLFVNSLLLLSNCLVFPCSMLPISWVGSWNGSPSLSMRSEPNQDVGHYVFSNGQCGATGVTFLSTWRCLNTFAEPSCGVGTEKSTLPNV